MITIKYFASLREKIGRDQDMVEYAPEMTIQSLWNHLHGNTELMGVEVKELLCAQNMEYTRWDVVLNDGDEIAFFPPVTGG
ncbi:Molybdopterin synthase sulfur carrier subunit [hydrothermal vent metagenome]|uniref:Molybdopterin synthase sulfur carrier subunit n=1 Tax=hydrothermal vent metagenome TaxID=652676 RepID=A0A3B0YP46_9ZZZZ